MIPPDLIPQYLPLDDSVLLMLGTLPVIIIPSMFLRRVEASSEPQGPSGGSSGIDGLTQGVNREVPGHLLVS